MRTEKKEDEQTILELKEQLNLIKNGPQSSHLQKSNDLGPYIGWQPEEVLQWVLSIENGMFLQYEHELTQRIMNAHVTGMDLDEMNVHWLGVISKAEDQQLLAGHIRKLVGKASENVSVNNDDAAAPLHHFAADNVAAPALSLADNVAAPQHHEDDEGAMTYI